MEMGNDVLVVGVGALGSALVRGIAAVPAQRPRLQIVDIDRGRAATLAMETSARAVAAEAIAHPVAIVVAAVKATDLTPALQQIRPAIGDQTVVVSCASGVALSTVAHALQNRGRLVRAVPNIAARVGASSTVLAAGPGASEADLARVSELFAAVGTVHRVPSESALHAVTALAANGPAFVALVLEALMDGGVCAGLPRTLAEPLTIEMARGTLALLERDLTPAALRAAVVSPAGSAAAGLAVLERAALRGALGDAVMAAADRSRELGRELLG